MTSLKKLLGKAPPIREVEDKLIGHIAYVLDRATYDGLATPLVQRGVREATAVS